MFCRNNTNSKHRSSHRAINARPRTSPLWRLSALALLSAACMTATAGVTTRVSVDSEGRDGVSSSYGGSLSADGRYVAFSSAASNLVPGDTNGTPDIFVHDRQTGEARRLSVDSAGAQGNSSSYDPVLSADGRYVAFESDGSNLVPGDTNGQYDVFVHDRQTGETRRVSVDSAGAQGNDYSGSPTISADGRYVAFASGASNLVPGDTNGYADVFVHDRETGEVRRVSVDSVGTQANAYSGYPDLSADGRYVAFTSAASNLVSGDTNGFDDAFVHDRHTGQTTRVSVDRAGAQANDDADYPDLSADGRYVAFVSHASNLVAGDTNEVSDIFVHDRQMGETTRASVDSTGAQSNHYSGFLDYRSVALNADGRYVAFHSYASNLVPGDTNGGRDVFVHDRQTGQTSRVSVDSTGAQIDGWFSYRSVFLSADGRYVVFESDASNLVPGDTNGGARDIFVHDRLATLLEGPHGTATCIDGVDNDGDGNVDALDADCALPPSPHMCSGKRVTIVGTPGSDTYTGTSSADVIATFGGDDMIDGARGDDVICGGDGNDTLLGRGGNDTLLGDSGNDRVIGGSDNDTLLGGGGNDKLNAGSGVDTCDGQNGSDTHLGGCETRLNIP